MVEELVVGGTPVSEVESILKVDLKEEAVVVFHGLPESINYCLTPPLDSDT